MAVGSKRTRAIDSVLRFATANNGSESCSKSFSPTSCFNWRAVTCSCPGMIPLADEYLSHVTGTHLPSFSH